MAPAAAASDEDNQDRRTIHKHYNISLVINLKRGKEEIDFANKETERLHTLIAGGTQADWAMSQVSSIHKMIFMPDTDAIKHELSTKLGKDDDDSKK